MTPARPLLLNAFAMNCVGHINHGLWTHPRDRSADYNDIAHWTGIVRTLERGLFDGLFLADIVGAYDVYQGSLDITLRESIQLPLSDPIPLVGALLPATRHLGFGITVNLTYEHPYLLARRFATLDHLSRGRVGWNIVTGYLDSAARAMGLPAQPEHDSRYDQADEFMDIAYRLWEASWDADAVVRDRAARVYTRPDGVRPVRHHGANYRVEGVALWEPSPQRTPLLRPHPRRLPAPARSSTPGSRRARRARPWWWSTGVWSRTCTCRRRSGIWNWRSGSHGWGGDRGLTRTQPTGSSTTSAGVSCRSVWPRKNAGSRR